MKIKQFANLPNIKALNIVAVSSLAIGIAASISAAPAQAVSITSGVLSFNDGALNTNVVGGGSIAPVAGNRFTVNFNPSNFATVLNASGSFETAGLSPNSPRYIASSSADYLFSGGNTYTQVGDLVFNFGQQVTANPLVARLTVGAGSIFSTSTVANATTFAFLSGNTTFLTQPDNILSQISVQPNDFRFSVDNLANNNPALGGQPNGSYSLATTAVPEPFTIIGTIIGGTAAFRMKKKLASKN